MQPTETRPLPRALETQTGDFNGALAAALSLVPAEQARLAQVLAVLAGTAVPTQTAQDSLEDDPQEVSVSQWLDSIEELSPRERVLLIDEALSKADAVDAPPLAAARRELFAQQPALAVRMAVEGVASRAPLLLMVGVCGIGLAIYITGRAVYHLIF